jgi:two-component system, NarL family, response regulator NreC
MVTVALADDHVVVRQGLRLLLESDPECEVVGEAADGIGALELVKLRKPNVLIVDLMMPGMDGLETTRRVSRLKSGTRVIVLTMYGDDAYLVDAFKGGAAAFVVKESCGDDLLQAVRDVAAGKCYVSPQLSAAFVIRYLRSATAAVLRLSRMLTTHQRRVLQLVLEGVSSVDIGARLKVSLGAVESDVATLVEKAIRKTHRLSRAH